MIGDLNSSNKRIYEHSTAVMPAVPCETNPMLSFAYLHQFSFGGGVPLTISSKKELQLQ